MLLDKPAGITSFQALGAVKRAVGIRRVGHAGTLDRFATGLLVVLCGSCTRIAGVFETLDKTYVATVRLGEETDTLDPEGEVVRTGEVPELSAIEAAVPGFIGRVMQLPPAYSALHVDGRRAYEIARSGLVPELAPREIRIDEIRVLAYRPPELEILVRCSRGTYVRSLARDLALAAGSCGRLQALRRTAVGALRADEAVAPEDFIPERDLEEAGRLLGRHGILPLRLLDSATCQKIQRGQKLTPQGGPSAPVSGAGAVALLGPSGRLLAIGRYDSGTIDVQIVLAWGGGPGR